MRLLVAVLLAGSAFAQKAKITGRATAPLGTAVPGATIRAAAPAGKAIRGRTSQQGTFRIVLGRSTKYRLEISAPGFKIVQREIEVAGDIDLGAVVLPVPDAGLIDVIIDPSVPQKPKH